MSSSEGEASSPPPPAGPPPTTGGRLSGAPSPPSPSPSPHAEAQNNLASGEEDAVRGSNGSPAVATRLHLNDSPTTANSTAQRSRPRQGSELSRGQDNGDRSINNVRRAASSATPTRMRLVNTPMEGFATPLRGASRSGGGYRTPGPMELDEGTLRQRRAVIDREHHLYRAAVREVVVRDGEGREEVILTHTRPDGVELVSRGIQTEYTKRHTRLGIIYRGHPMSKIVIFIAFVSPVLVVLAFTSFYVNWRPQFHLSNGRDKGNVNGENPPSALLYLLGADVFQFFMCYLCVLPAAYKSLTSGDEATAQRDMLNVAATFCVSFLPVWFGEFIIGDSVPYYTSHEGMWSSYAVLWGGGVAWYAVVWFVYSTYMAELMHAKARRAADEYLFAIRHGYYRQQMERARRGVKYQRGGMVGAIEEPTPRNRENGRTSAGSAASSNYTNRPRFFGLFSSTVARPPSRRDSPAGQQANSERPQQSEQGGAHSDFPQPSSSSPTTVDPQHGESPEAPDARSGEEGREDRAQTSQARATGVGNAAVAVDPPRSSSGGGSRELGLTQRDAAPATAAVDGNGTDSATENRPPPNTSSAVKSLPPPVALRRTPAVI